MQEIQTSSEPVIYNPLVSFAAKKESYEEPHLIKWTKEEYHYLAELGFFEGRRTEFLEGEIIEMPTMNTPHATGLTLTDESIREVFARGFVIRNQMPLNFGENFEIVPDIAVIKGKTRDFLQEHPQTADLVIEISDTTLRYDRTRKLSLYAKFSVQEYWIVNLRDRRLEIYRRPIEDENAFYGFSYAETLIFTETDFVAPLAMPNAKIKVADVLP